MKHTTEQIRVAAQKSNYYVTPGGMCVRIEMVLFNKFFGINERTNEDFEFYFEQMVEADEQPVFYHLVRTPIEGTESAEWFEP